MPATSEDPERGSSLPLVLLCWLIAALMGLGAIAASDAFLEQRDVQSVCDSAALAAANQADEAAVYRDGANDAALPLSRAAAEAAVADHLADGGLRLDGWSVETAGDEVTVRCTRQVEIAFGELFLAGNRLERTAVTSARAATG